MYRKSVVDLTRFSICPLLGYKDLNLFREKIMAVNNQRDTAYGLNQALIGLVPRPIVSRRNPTVNDKAPIGQIWVNRAVNTAYILTQITGNQAIWTQQASTVGNLTVGGTITAGTGLTVTAGGATITAGGLTVTAGGAAITGATAVTGALSATTTVTAGTNLVATAGSVSAGTTISATTTVTAGTGLIATTGGVLASAGDMVATLGDITADAGNIEATLGSVSAGTTVTAGTGVTATTGDITATHGDVVISTATHGITLPGPVRIITGAGAPAAGLAVNVGDMYIRTDAGAAAERIYICTVAGTFTNVTCAA